MSTSEAEAVEERLRSEFERLDGVEEPTPADLERVRQALPVEPVMARAVQRALPWPYSEVFEYVKGSTRQSAYWRVKPNRYVSQSEAQRQSQERFRAAAQAAEGVRGTVTYKGEEVPASAAAVAEQVTGESGGGRRLPKAAYRAAARIRTLLSEDD